ncbi:MAG: hypothetical protein U0457_21345 [Candidatus Sericytochromatia bacterium]
MRKLLSSILLSTIICNVSNIAFADTGNGLRSTFGNHLAENKQNEEEKKEDIKEIKEIKVIKKYKKEEEVDYIPEKNYKGWGVSLGYLSASGLSYRTFFADNWGMKATGAAYMQNGRGFGTFGMQGMYVHSENSIVRFYSLLGASYYGSNNSSNYTIQPNVDPVQRVDPPFEHSLGLGGGIGIEIGRKESGISMSLEFPITFIFKNFTKLDSIYPIPQISFMYNF